MTDYPEDFAEELAERDRHLTQCPYHGVQEHPCPHCFGEEPDGLYMQDD